MKLVLPIYTESTDVRTLLLDEESSSLTASFHRNPAYIELWIKGVRVAVVSREDIMRLSRALDY